MTTSAKQDFLSRILVLNDALTEQSVMDFTPSDVKHNSIARMLRNGLAVVAFATLEDFIKSRSSEILNQIGTTGIQFRQLPEKLRNAVTFESIKALQYQVSIIDENTDKIAYIQSMCKKIASTALPPIDIMDHSFAYEQANVNAETIKKILLSFGVIDPWKQISNLSNNAGLTALSLDIIFKNAANRRHRAAHVANTITPQNDIIGFVKEAIGIAFGFDALISYSYSKIKVLDPTYISSTSPFITSTMVKTRKIVFDQNKWKLYGSGQTRAQTSNIDKAYVIQMGINKCRAGREMLLVYNENGMVIDWFDNHT